MNAAKILVYGLIVCCAAAAGAREVSIAPTDDFEKAFDCVQKTRKAGEPVEIVFEDGVHLLKRCIALGPSDSGLVFRARNPWKAVLVGGVSLTLKDFKPLTASTAPKGLPAVAKEKVRAWNVPQDLRRALGRLWDGEPILLANLAVRPMARWPNGGYVTIPKSGAGAEKRHLKIFDKRMNGWCGGIATRRTAPALRRREWNGDPLYCASEGRRTTEGVATDPLQMGQLGDVSSCVGIKQLL